MDATAVKGESALTVEEARLAGMAAAGDGSAFASLYGRYEQRAFNVAYRIVGSEAEAAQAVQQAFLGAMRRPPRADDGDPSFGPHLLAEVRSACHDLMAERQPRPRERISESAATLGEGEPQGEIREASMRLPEHQREALALGALEELSYEEIATIMETNRSAVAQLISRARINLHDELRGNVLASVAAPSPECERALPLIASREDGQLDAASRDAAWLDAHLANCGRCGLGVEVMQEAGASYRAWAPIAAIPWLLEETMAKAAELVGADWSEEIAEAMAARGTAASLPGTAADAATESPPGKQPRRRVTLAAGLAALLLLTGAAAAVFAGDDQPAAPADPAAGSAQGPSSSSEPSGNTAKTAVGKRGGKKKARRTAAGATGGTAPAATTAGETISEPAPAPVQAAAGGGAPSKSGPNRSSGETAIQPTQPTSVSKPRSKPKPTAAPAAAPDPAPTPAPVAEDPGSAEESPGKSSGKGDPPGKPADRPPK